MYMKNDLIKPGKLTMKGVPIDLTKVTTPIFLVGAELDALSASGSGPVAYLDALPPHAGACRYGT